MPDNPELSPCPFCARNPLPFGNGWVICYGPGHQSIAMKTDEWNSRPAPALPDERVKLVEELASYIPDPEEDEGAHPDFTLPVALARRIQAALSIPVTPLPPGTSHHLDDPTGEIANGPAPLPDEGAAERLRAATFWPVESPHKGHMRSDDALVQVKVGDLRFALSGIASIPSTEWWLREALEMSANVARELLITTFSAMQDELADEQMAVDTLQALIESLEAKAGFATAVAEIAAKRLPAPISPPPDRYVFTDYSRTLLLRSQAIRRPIMTDYPSDWVPAERGRLRGESEFERVNRLGAEAEVRARESAMNFALEGRRVACACPPAGDYGPNEIANGKGGG